jgi:hypothetical protein
MMPHPRSHFRWIIELSASYTAMPALSRLIKFYGRVWLTTQSICVERPEWRLDCHLFPWGYEPLTRRSIITWFTSCHGAILSNRKQMDAILAYLCLWEENILPTSVRLSSAKAFEYFDGGFLELSISGMSLEISSPTYFLIFCHQ